MATDRPTISRLASAVVLSGILFVVVTTNFYSLAVLLLILVCTVLVAGYHAYDGGSPRTTILLLLIVAGGLMAGVRVNDLGGCGAIPGCFPDTQLQTYLEWTVFAILLGIGTYLAGFFARRRFNTRS